MVASSKVESPTVRFVPYVEELREFFQSRQLAHGQPEDLDKLALRLSDPAFHEEMVSMVRAMQYREEERLSRTDLLDILVAASGGTAATEDPGVAHGPVREIFAFLTELLHSRPHLPEALLPTTDEAAAEPPTSHEELATHCDAGAVWPVPDASTPSSENSAAGAPAWSHAEVKFPAKPTPVGLLGRAYWVPGVLLLALVGVVTLFLYRKAMPGSPTPTSRTARATTPPSTNSAALPHKMHHFAVPPASSSATALAPALTLPAEDAAHTTASRKSQSRPTDAAARTRPAAHTARAAGEGPLGAGAESREGVFLASSGAMASHLLYAPAPAYPRLARFARVEGQVIVQVVVSRKGSVAATRVLEGPLLLRGAAEHAIRHWRYRPYTVDGKATDVAAIVTVSYRLR